MHCVDLGESFPTSIYLQKSVSIQPRTSPSKFGEKYSILFTGVLNEVPAGEVFLPESAQPQVLVELKERDAGILAGAVAAPLQPRQP